MWLLCASDRKLKLFNDADAIQAKYAILSHTWGEDEALFADMRCLETAKEKAGYRKIDLSCVQALEDGLQYIWIDTCCISKDSSAEPSEAIKSMFRWYRDSSVCYTFLSDVELKEPLAREQTISSMRQSRWFTRGWTLQELIASPIMDFYDSQGNFLGTKEDLCSELERITTIPSFILQNSQYLNTINEAYCLLGIFDINIPMLYGEGRKAFGRLQEAILRSSTDHSLFTWQPSQSNSDGLLATSPSEFSKSGKVVRYAAQVPDSFEVTNAGLRINLPLVKADENHYAILNCRYEDDFGVVLGLIVELLDEGEENSRRVTTAHICRTSTDSTKSINSSIWLFDPATLKKEKSQLLLAPRDASSDGEEPYTLGNGTKIWFQLNGRCSEELLLDSVQTSGAWNPRTGVLSWPGTLHMAEYDAELTFIYKKLDEADAVVPFCRLCQRHLGTEYEARVLSGQTLKGLQMTLRDILPQEVHRPGSLQTVYGYHMRRRLRYCRSCYSACWEDIRTGPRMTVYLKVKVENYQQECAIRATWTPKSNTSYSTRAETGSGWTLVPDDELLESHMVSSLSNGRYVIQTEVTRELSMRMRMPVYVVRIGALHPEQLQDAPADMPRLDDQDDIWRGTFIRLPLNERVPDADGIYYHLNEAQ